MTFDAQKWLNELASRVKEQFKNRVLFIGYHGSYRRGEATPESDIDMVIILDTLELADLKAYKNIVSLMPNSEKACGFISGKKEIQNWSKSDMFQFSHETEALYGNLNEIIEMLNIDDIKATVKSSSEMLYHAACHSFLFDDNLRQSLKALYKMTFFILQADYFLYNSKYIPTKLELVELLDSENRYILENCIKKESFAQLSEDEVENLYKILINWCSNKITSNKK